jgi:hypothetical protein
VFGEILEEIVGKIAPKNPFHHLTLFFFFLKKNLTNEPTNLAGLALLRVIS